MIYRVAKRVLDIVLAVCVLMALLPVLLVLWVIVKVTLGEPVIFTQERPGRKGQVFMLYKFRTMKDNKGLKGVQSSDADRLTSTGVVMRKTSLDEIPSLVNIIRGEMSWVGPRPLLKDYLPLYTVKQRKRHDVLPGLTGLAQVMGRNNTTWDKRLEYDVFYVENMSIWLDIKILLRTVGVVLTGYGVSGDGHVTMERFKGTEVGDIE